MKHIMSGLIGCLVAFVIAGCAGKEDLLVATCDKYENGVCVNAKTEALHECKDPFVQGDKTYCHSK